MLLRQPLRLQRQEAEVAVAVAPLELSARISPLLAAMGPGF